MNKVFKINLSPHVAYILVDTIFHVIELIIGLIQEVMLPK